MRIGLNALAVSPERPGGDVTYVLELARRLPGIDPNSEWVVFAAPWARKLIGKLPANARVVPCAVPHRSNIARALWEQTALVPLAARERLDALHAPVNVVPLAYPGTTVLTLHEAEPFMPRNGIPLPLLAWWRAVRSSSAKRADRILTVSEAARRDLERWMQVPSSRTHVVHLGVDVDRFSAGRTNEPRPLGSEPYVLWVGRPYPGKNIDTLLEAFAALRRAGRTERLVMVGPPGWKEGQIRRRIETQFETGVVHRLPAIWSELPAWYAHAAVFAFPSSHETFGLPVLEAMASGVPVIAGDIAALHEVSGDACMYVQPGDARALAAALGRILSDADLRQGLSRSGLERARHFNWDDCARQTYRHFCEVAKT